MFCKNCGKPIFEGAAFCSHCGVSLAPNVSPEPVSAQPSQAETVTQNANEASQGSIWSPADAPNGNPLPPPPPPPHMHEENLGQERGNEGFAIASLVLGILGLSSSFLPIPSILAIIFGVLGKKSKKQGMAKAGFILGIVGVVLVALSLLSIVVRLFTNGFLSNSVFFEEFLNEFAGEGLYF